MLITEIELNAILLVQPIAALLLRARPPKQTDVTNPDYTIDIDETSTRINICDIYLFSESGDSINCKLHPDQLALPVGAISGTPRWSAKGVLTTMRSNTVIIDDGGGGGYYYAS